MRFAKARTGERICADDAVRKEEYHCPSCNGLLILKRGSILLPHFAHYPNKPCNDTWEYCESSWQQEWQNKFPAECQEIAVSHSAQSHRADILAGNDVILFEETAITAKFFNEKTKFFQHGERNVFWVINAQEDIDAGILRYSRKDKNGMFWDHPPVFLKKVDLKANKKLHILLDMGKLGLKKVEWVAPGSNFERFIVDRGFSPDLLTEEGRKTVTLNQYGRFEVFKRENAPWHRKISCMNGATDPRWHICDKTGNCHADECKSCAYNLINEYRSANPKSGSPGGLYFYCKYPEPARSMVAQKDDQETVPVPSIWLK